MRANNRLTVVSRNENPQRPGTSPDPGEAHRLLESFWRIRDAKTRARLLKEAETAASRER